MRQDTAVTSVWAAGRVWRLEAAVDLDTLLKTVQTDAELEAFPYGLLLWPSAIALADALGERRDWLRGKRVLELGCGPGLPGLTAQWLGAQATLSDHQPEPLALARHNAAGNGIDGLEVRQGDWRDFPALTPFDLVLGSDILYERSLHRMLLDLLPRLVGPEGEVLLADPLRPQSAVFVDALEHDGWEVQMRVRVVAWQERDQEIAVFTARRALR